MNGKVIGLLAVFLVTLLVHAPAKDGEFLFFDDDRFVERNTHIDSLDNPGRFFTDIETTTSIDSPTKDIYRPIRTLTYACITAMWEKSDASAFHAVSITLHALTAVLLAMVLMAAGVPVWPAAAGTLFWSLHPTTVEVTAWVCSLGDIWCALFSLAAVLIYAWRPERIGQRLARMVAASLALLLALLSKEHAVVVPGLWVAWDLFVRKQSIKETDKVSPAIGLAVVVGFLMMRSNLGLGMSQTDDWFGGTYFDGLVTMLSGLGWYATTTLLPFGSTFQAWVEPSFLGGVIGAATLGALVFALIRGNTWVRLASAWFLIALVPVSNVFVPLKIPTADRFLYISLMGGGFLVADLARRKPRWVTPIVLVVLAGLTVDRIGDWKNDRALYAAGFRVNPKSPMLMWQRASAAAEQAMLVGEDKRLGMGRFAAAERKVNEAIQGYRLYLRNARGRGTIQVLMELADLLNWWGTCCSVSTSLSSRRPTAMRSMPMRARTSCRSLDAVA